MFIKTLKNYFRISIFLITLLLFFAFYFFSSYIHIKLTINENQKISEALSKQVFNSMYQVMRKGWTRDELQEFIQQTKHSFQGSSYNVDIFRGKNVESLYGEISQPKISPNILYVFDKKEKLFISNNNQNNIITPILAKGECLQCHTNVKDGDILGAVEIQYNFKDIIDETRYNYFLLSLFIFPVFLLISYLISAHLLRKIQRSMNQFENKINDVNSVKDFKNITISNDEHTFQEFHKITNGLVTLSDKLKNIAVDKNILEFEVKLLDKMVITSDVIQDWKEYIKDLLNEINLVLPVHCLITIFKTENEQYEIEIFWNQKPSKNLQAYLNEIAKKMIYEHHNTTVMEYFINHNISNEEKCLITLDTKDIEHEAKSILLDTPKIGGIVGLGVQSNLNKDSIHSIVIDSILTTLLNLVGSIKAINKYTEHLEFYATRDPLTGLFSQRVFRDLVAYEVKRANRHKYEFALLVIDCDNFKPINDTYGHSFGDEFLKHFAFLLEDTKRDEDILSRYGGDEFTLVLPQTSHKEAYTVAQRVLQKVQEFELASPDGTITSMTVSIGMSLYPEHSQNPKELFDIADSMMYKAKYEGKNAIRYPDEHDIEEIHQQLEDHSIVVLDAIKHEKIVAHFQPILNIQSNHIDINELLMRIEVDNEILPAGKFIETAEALGVVHQMDYMVIEQAFRQIQKTNYTGVLFINLSPKALMIGEFINKIVKLSHKYNIEKQNIVFEITERETVKSFSLLERFVQNLKLEGFRFAIDDFGSGFSSFHYIKRFPIDFIKIDGDFIININKDPKDLAFVKSMISLARELEVKTVAEFVEDKEILQTLKDIEIDFAQGYHIGKPSRDIIKT
jgi:diguanylate cyclase (GGDEF)-like protein